ncbi:MAG TPA: hypothetical protein VK327_17140, partial [Candidatus Paceibacterota bacterium]|nr:hypothetical protein [Candidatus Paceibacterota bacterium]
MHYSIPRSADYKSAKQQSATLRYERYAQWRFAMNPDGPRNERELLEAKLTALLLGELPSAETEALRKQIAADAGLAQLHERLKLTIGLVREGVCEPIADQPAAPKLSAERRQKLLAQFKTVRPEQFVQSQHRTINWLVPVGIAAALLLFAILSAPNFVKSRSTSAENAVINNLRNLDSAKQQWAADNKKSPNDQPTIQDLTPYLGRSPQSVRGETYVPGKVSEPVKVEMDAKTAPKRMPGFVLTRTYDGPNGPRTEYMFRQNQSAAGYFVASKPAEAPALAPM